MSKSTAPLFGRLLRECRKRAGLSRQTLAVSLSVDRSLISRIETGRIKPPLDAPFYERLRKVPGFGDTDITLLRKAAQADKSSEDLEKLLAQLSTHHARLAGLSIALPELVQQSTQAPQALPTVEEAPDILTEFVQADTCGYDSISSSMAPKEVERGDHLTSPTPEQGDPSAAQGTNAPERGRGQPSRRERGRKPASPEQAGKRGGVLYEGSRARYTREHLQATAPTLTQRMVDAVNNPDDPLSSAAVQALGSFAEAAEKSKVVTINAAAREFNVPENFLRRWSKQRRVIPIVVEGKGQGSPTYLDREKTQEVTEIYHEARRQGRQPKKLLESKYPDISKLPQK